jgi:hypothetical protein
VCPEGERSSAQGKGKGCVVLRECVEGKESRRRCNDDFVSSLGRLKLAFAGGSGSGYGYGYGYGCLPCRSLALQRRGEGLANGPAVLLQCIGGHGAELS